MIICPKCGAMNGQRKPNPVKCTRCWHVFVRADTQAVASVVEAVKEAGRKLRESK